MKLINWDSAGDAQKKTVRSNIGDNEMTPREQVMEILKKMTERNPEHEGFKPSDVQAMNNKFSLVCSFFDYYSFLNFPATTTKHLYKFSYRMTSPSFWPNSPTKASLTRRRRRPLASSTLGFTCTPDKWKKTIQISFEHIVFHVFCYSLHVFDIINKK